MFEKKYHYETVSPAVERLKSKGYTLDFDLQDNYLVAENRTVSPEDFEITDLFHYENETDLSDESNVFAIDCKNGIKGFLVTGLGMCPESFKRMVMDKLLVEEGT